MSRLNQLSTEGIDYIFVRLENKRGGDREPPQYTGGRGPPDVEQPPAYIAAGVYKVPCPPPPRGYVYQVCG